MRLRSLVGLFALGSCAAGFVAACVGDSPDTTTPATDAGASEAGDPSDTGSSADAGSDGNMTVSSPIIDVAVGRGFSCAARQDGSVVCWGANTYAQAGQPIAGGDTCGGIACRVPTRVAGLSDVEHVAAGNQAACAVTKSGTVLCWGHNDSDVLGHPANQDDDCGGGERCTPTPRVVDGVSGAVGVAVGTNTACAWTSAGKVLCWGADLSGELGRGAHDDGPLGAGPALGFDTNGAKLVTVDAYGSGHFCAIRNDDSLSCWGRNSASEVGYIGTQSVFCNGGNERCEPTPHEVRDSADASVRPVTSVVANDGATCVIVSGATAYCWGYVGHAIVGKPDASTVTTPTARPDLDGLTGLSGTYTHACGIGTGKTVHCWGVDDFGQLGVAPNVVTDACPKGPCTSTPVTVSGVLAEKVFVGGDTSFALTAEGKLLGWGGNDHGALGHVPAAGENACPKPCSPTPVEVVLPP